MTEKVKPPKKKSDDAPGEVDDELEPEVDDELEEAPARKAKSAKPSTLLGMVDHWLFEEKFC